MLALNRSVASVEFVAQYIPPSLLLLNSKLTLLPVHSANRTTTSMDGDETDSGFCPWLNPDPDIAGIGAIISFISTAGMTLIFSVGAVAFNLSGSRSSNEVDVRSAATLEKVSAQRTFDHARERFTALFFPLVFTLGDMQLITGLAVLISGWIRLRAGLSVYHFTIITDLAWMASDTQLVAFFALFQCGRATSQRRHAVPDIQLYVFLPSRLCRAFGMLCMFGMLFVASVIFSDRSWWNCRGLPAITFFSNLKPGGARLSWAIFNYFMLVWGYGAALIPLFDPTYRAYEAIKSAITIGGHLPVRFGYATWSTVSDRAQNTPDIVLCTGDDVEADWGFGQLVPMVLLILPLLAALDAYGKHGSAVGASLPHLRSVHSDSQLDLLQR
ncbi:hypothetical protein B0H19DRAFT_1383771 [Mycena capillaripes]|nr:hypothetical protein B0H19DRAFT_1383725 [Mycena capillaripes]KAJ6533152.1 hypothetical protein B0H19DRAFT_1383771 [Mycena capillaripes]